MFAASKVQLRKLGAYSCRFYHTSFRVESKRNLVPERFINLAEGTRFTNILGKKMGKDYYKRRYNYTMDKSSTWLTFTTLSLFWPTIGIDHVYVPNILS